MKNLAWTAAVVLPLALNFACSAGAGSNSGGGDGDSGGGDGDAGGDGDSINVGDGDSNIDVGDGDGSPGMIVDEPQTCADAAASRSYVGCEFWPTITANPVFLEFEFAVVMANGTDEAAAVTITGPHGYSHEDTIPPGELKTFKLPWVPELKGPEFKVSTPAQSSLARHDQTSLSMEGGAYNVKTSVPVSAWQFSPLNFSKQKGECGRLEEWFSAETTQCRAASNDASLLLPTTAMTGNYRVGSYGGFEGGADWGSTPGGFAITATADGTTVDIQLPPNCDAYHPSGFYMDQNCTVAGGVVPAAVKDEVLSFDMNAGDVIQILGAHGGNPQIVHADLSGSLINASQPVQIIAYTPITFIPDETSNPDHIEEVVLPAEVIGREYIVPVPSAHSDGAPNVVGHVVRIFGNVDGTVLEYPEGKPAGAPDVINAGEVYELPPRACAGNCTSADAITEPFVVRGDQPFSVNSYHLAGRIQAPTWPEDYAQPGDPAVTMMVTPEQFRQNYTFLAPVDFMSNWADITVPTGADVVLDGVAIAETPTPIGASGWGVLRVRLDGAAGGIHTLETTHEAGLGLQVSGFGNATSYYYPGGLDLKLISEPPVIVVR